MMTLPLVKPGEQAQKLSLSLNKGERFTIDLAWDSPHDLDAHALLAFNLNDAGAKVTSFEQVLSTYNSKKTNPNGLLITNADGSFSTPCGALTHSGDSRTGVDKDIDESIVVDGSKVTDATNEIPIFVTNHDKGTFASVKTASITIKDGSGKVLGSYELSKEFNQFNSVQMGSLLRRPDGWHFAAVGSGFNGDFNTILGHFS